MARIFGTTEAHARRWLAQRTQLVQALGAVRGRASFLIAELGGDGFPVVQLGMRESRKQRVNSAQTPSQDGGCREEAVGGKEEIRMNRTEYLALSTRLARDLKDWIEESRDHHGLTESQLVSLQDAADIIDQTTVRVARIEESHG